MAQDAASESRKKSGSFSLSLETEAKVKIEAGLEFTAQMSSRLSLMDFENIYNSDAVQKDPQFEQILKIPDDVVQVNREKRNRRTLLSSVPAEVHQILSGTPNNLNHLKQCIDFFEKDFVRVNRKYASNDTWLLDETFSTSQNEMEEDGRSKSFSNLREQIFEMNEDHSADSTTGEASDPKNDLDISMLDYDGTNRDQTNASTRQQNRQNVIQIFGNSSSNSKPIKLPAFVEKPGRQILVEVKKLSFQLENIEPFYGSLALYDFSTKSRLSETFYFDLNGDKFRTPESSSATIRLPTRALFTLPAPSSEVFFLLRIEKIIQGDIEQVSDPYMKPGNLKDKDKEKLKQQAQLFISKLADWHQPFAWGVLPIYQIDESNSLNLAIGEQSIRPLYRQKGADTQDSVFLDFINDSKTGSSRKKVIPGGCTIEITEINETDTPSESAYPPGIISPSLIPITSVDEENVIREIQSFPPMGSLGGAYSSYLNTLYIYPESLNFNNRGGSVSARNVSIKVHLLDSDQVVQPLKAFYTPAALKRDQLATEVVTSLLYHNKTPTYYDEIKIELPAVLNPNHHLLFTFLHVTCQIGKSDKKAVDDPATPVGYAVLPLYNQSRIVSGDYNLPVMAELTPKYLSPEVESSLKYVDSKKPIFKLKAEVISTIYTTDKHLNSFFEQYQAFDDKLAKSVSALQKVKPSALAQFFPIILNELFQLISTSEPQMSYNSFLILLNLLSSVYNSSMEGGILLRSYVEYVFDNPMQSDSSDKKTKLIYELLTKHWIQHLKKDVETDTSIKFGWFLFQIIFKSMVLRLEEVGPTGIFRHRVVRFGREYLADLKELFILLTFEIQSRSKSGLNLAKQLVKYMAMFTNNLLSAMDRSFVFQLIEIVAEGITWNKDSENLLIEFKFEFFKLIGHYEHFVQLNLPLPMQVSTTSLADALHEHSETHFIVGLFLRHIALYLSHKEKTIRMKGVSTLRGLLESIDTDDKYQDPVVKQRVSSLYLPYLFVVLDHSDAFKETDFEEKRAIFLGFLFLLKNIQSDLLVSWWSKETQTRLQAFFDVLQQCADVYEFLDEERWIEKMSQNKTWKSHETKAALENYYFDSSRRGAQGGTKGYRTYRTLREKRAEALSRRPSQDMQGRKMSDASVTTGTEGGVSGSPGRGSIEPSWKAKIGKFTRSVKQDDIYQELVESNLSTEASMVLLDTIELFVSAFRKELTDSGSVAFLMDSLFSVLMFLFKRNSSELFLSSLYNSLSAFVFKFSHSIFYQSTSYVSDLCMVTVKHCNSSIPAVRKKAAGFLYLLMKKNYEEVKKNFQRVKGQTTISLSKLVGTGLKSDINLRKSLKAISEYAFVESLPASGTTEPRSSFHQKKKSLSSSPTSFAVQVEELTDKLYLILRDSIKINQNSSEDPEMMADLYYRMTKSYTNAPDLRVTWLESLANFHIKQKNWAEAAECVIHIAALVVDYLNYFEPTPGIPQGSNSFTHISTNVLQEISTNDQFPDEEGVCESAVFSEKGLLKLLSETISHLEQAELYEKANEVFKLMLPIYERDRDYEKLSQCHGQLQELFTKIINCTQTQSRLLGTYYRVGFYGELFEELDGKEFIYKEPKITRLVEIKERLKRVYAARFGNEDMVQIITDSKAVDRSKLNPAFVYLQLTAVTPYFEDWEMAERVTYYERNTSLTRFIYASPFTTTGKSHAESIKDQHQRKVILTVEGAFPHMKKRLMVVQRQEIDLTPIENSIENIESRRDIILSELRTTPPNIKSLQSVLQGSLIPTVNVGIVKICHVFLGENASEYPSNFTDHLRQAFREFLKACEDGLMLNKKLIGPDQIDFQREMEAGYETLKKEMEAELNLVKEP